jgi:HK97 family phage major capsid protein
MPRNRPNQDRDPWRFHTISEMRSTISQMRQAEYPSAEIDEAERVLEAKVEQQERLEDLAGRQATPARDRNGFTSTPEPTTHDDERVHPMAREARDAALRTLESRNKAGDIDAPAAEGLDSLLRHEDPMGLLARQIEAVGSDEYEAWFRRWFESGVRFGPTAGVHTTAREDAARERVAMAERALGLGSGVSLPFALDPSIVLTDDGAISPIRRIARKVRIANTNQWRAATGTNGSASYDSEASEVSDDSPSLAQPVVDCQRVTYFVPMSYELDQDWGTLRTELGRLMADARDTLEADKFLLGAGSTEPEGLLTGATITVDTLAASFAADDVTNVLENVPPRFRARAAWVAPLGVINDIGGFETQNGSRRYPSVDEDRLISRPLYEWSGIPGGTATGSTLAAVGDFSTGYAIVDRVGMSAAFLPMYGTASHRPTGQFGFYAFGRNSGTVLVPEAFRVLLVQ